MAVQRRGLFQKHGLGIDARDDRERAGLAEESKDDARTGEKIVDQVAEHGFFVGGCKHGGCLKNDARIAGGCGRRMRRRD